MGLAGCDDSCWGVEDAPWVGDCAAGVVLKLSQALRDAGVDVPLRDFGIPQRFLDHTSRKEVMAEIGLTAPDIARQVTGLVAKLDGRYDSEPAATVD